MAVRSLLFFWMVMGLGWAQSPPVVLVDGYHLVCGSSNLTSAQDFGDLANRLQANGRQVTFFGTCAQAGKPSIEDLGNALGETIRRLNTPQVDIVSHSMGGLIVRSYLAGKQTAAGVFTPPLDPLVRKWVSIATPNFGALIPTIAGDFLLDQEERELVPGSQFLFDLATWNQNHDDLRGVDAVGIIGNAGGFGPFTGGSDGTVAVTSASMSFVLPDERTRVLPYCHGAGDLTSILGLGCDGPPLAKIQSDNPLSWQIISSFLADTNDWRSVGHTPSQDPVLSRYGGVLRQTRNALGAQTGNLQDTNLTANAPMAGGYSVVIDKPGPKIALIAPSAARLGTLSLAPRMLISIYGSNLGSAVVSLNGQNLVVNYASDTQVNALLPDGLTGLQKLTISNGTGSDTVNVLLEPAVPAIFTLDGSGRGAAAVIRQGNAVSLFLTGLGSAGTTPVVIVNGAAVPVTYAGPAPGFPGLDQINIVVPQGGGTVQVRVGRQVSNAVTI